LGVFVAQILIHSSTEFHKNNINVGHDCLCGAFVVKILGCVSAESAPVSALSSSRFSGLGGCSRDQNVYYEENRGQYIETKNVAFDVDRNIGVDAGSNRVQRGGKPGRTHRRASGT
jgi:hypothetical protein